MLRFAAALHASLASLATGSGAATRARMGVAFGEAAFLLAADAAAPPADEGDGDDGGGGGGGGDCGGFVSVQGDVVNVAARMESLAAPGLAVVHSSAALRWAAEAAEGADAGAGRSAPVLRPRPCKGKEPQPAAVFDLAAGAFLGEGDEEGDMIRTRSEGAAGPSPVEPPPGPAIRTVLRRASLAQQSFP
jgi:hypothetical protein